MLFVDDFKRVDLNQKWLETSDLETCFLSVTQSISVEERGPYYKASEFGNRQSVRFC